MVYLHFDVELSNTPKTAQANDSEARDLCVGRFAARRVPVPLFDVVANCITIRGSFVGTRQDIAEALAFAAEGKVKADIELQPLSSINQVFDRLEHGLVASRVVLDFARG
jgi:D-arabinose 1-dehydrogenase-like Zn-dependent alcohol dehydrogenase